MTSISTENTPGKFSDKENQNSQGQSTLRTTHPGSNIDYTKYLSIHSSDSEVKKLDSPVSDTFTANKESISGSDYPSKEDTLVSSILDDIQQNCRTEGITIDPRFWGIIVPIIYAKRESFTSGPKRGNFDILQDTIARLSDENVLLKKNLAKKTTEAENNKSKTGELTYRVNHLQSEIEKLNTLLLDRMSDIIYLKEDIAEKSRMIADFQKAKTAEIANQIKKELTISIQKEEPSSLIRLGSNSNLSQTNGQNGDLSPTEITTPVNLNKDNEEQKMLQEQVLRSLKTEIKQKNQTLADKNKEIANFREILNQNGATIREMTKENDRLNEKIKNLETQLLVQQQSTPSQSISKDYENQLKSYQQLFDVLLEQRQKEIQLIKETVGEKGLLKSEAELFVTPKAEKREILKTPDSSTTDQTQLREIESLRMRVKELEDHTQDYDEICKKYEEVKRSCDLLAIVNQQLSVMNTEFSTGTNTNPPSPTETKKLPKKEISTSRELPPKPNHRTEESMSPRARENNSPLSDRSLQTTVDLSRAGTKKGKVKKVDIEKLSLASQKANKKRNWGEERRIYSENFAGKFDIVFCVDCTDSMGPYLLQLRNACYLIQRAINQDFDFIEPDITFGFVGYRDHPPLNGNTWVTKVQDLTDIETCTKFIAAMTAKSGPKNDPPEAVLSGIYDSIDKISWRENKNEKVLRMIIHIGDAPPHGRLFNNGKNDYYPNGDPSGINIQQIASRMLHMDIYYRLVKIGHQLDIMEKEFSRNIADMYSTELEKAEELDELLPGLVLNQVKLLNSTLSIKDKVFLNRPTLQNVKRTQKMGECYTTGLIFDEYIEFIDHEIADIPIITHLTFFYSANEILGVQTEYDVNGEKASAKPKIACVGPAKEKLIQFEDKEGVESITGYFKENGGICGLVLITTKSRVIEIGCKSNKKLTNAFRGYTKLVSIGGSLRNTSIDSLYFYYVTSN